MTWWWIFFGVFILSMLALDLGVFNRRTHVVKIKESLLWTAFWITLALLFCTGVHFFYGHQKSMEFLAGYLIEYSEHRQPFRFSAALPLLPGAARI